ncbi:MAG: Flp family type IVb pilin [Bacillota bacterium]
MVQAHAWLRRLLVSQDGQSTLEYGLLVSLIAVAAALAVSAMGSALQQLFQQICDAVAGGPCT